MAISYIPLDDCRISEMTVFEKKQPQPGIDIYIASSNRHYILMAKDDAERKEWIAVLAAAQNEPPAPPVLLLLTHFAYFFTTKNQLTNNKVAVRKHLPSVPLDSLEVPASDASDTTDIIDTSSSKSLFLPNRPRDVNPKRYTTQLTELDLATTAANALDRV